MLNPTINISGLSGDAYSKLLEGLASVNRQVISESPDIPSLYDSGIYYKEEQGGSEEWLTIPQLLERGYGDCEDLTGWRLAELRNEGIDAKPLFIDNGNGYHAVVELPDGSIEDPSLILETTVGNKPKNLTYKIIKKPYGYKAIVSDGNNNYIGYGNNKMKAVVKGINEMSNTNNVGFLGDLITAITKPETVKNIKNLVTYGRGKKQEKEEEKEETQEKTLLALLKLLLKGEKMDTVGQRRRQRRKKPRRGQMVRQDGAVTKQRRFQILKRELTKALNKAKAGINKYKRKLATLETKVNSEIRELTREQESLSRDFSRWVEALQSQFAMYAQYYSQGYDVRDQLEEMQNMYFDALDIYENAFYDLQDEIEMLKTNADIAREEYQDKIDYGEQYIKDKETEIEERIEAIS